MSSHRVAFLSPATCFVGAVVVTHAQLAGNPT